jgi:hypothetical protein
MRHVGGTRLLALLIGVSASVPSLAAHWVAVGSAYPGHGPGKVMVDTESVQKLDRFTIVDIMTVYATPIVNSHNITLDRFVHETAFDCARRTFVGMKTIGYLGGKRVGSSENADWRDEAAPLPNDALSNRIYGLVCGRAAPTPRMPRAVPH